MLQLAKSAVCAGALTLREHEGIEQKELDAAYIAGGFGSYLNMHSAEKIGLLPSFVAKKSVAVGNAALVGASMLLLDKEHIEICRNIAKSARTVSLSSNPHFTGHYMSCMIFSKAE